jgi:hypothetical protein
MRINAHISVQLSMNVLIRILQEELMFEELGYKLN